MICGNQREFFVGVFPDIVFNEVAGMHEDNGGGGVKVEDELLRFPVIATSLLALGSVDGEREELVVLGRFMIIYICCTPYISTLYLNSLS